MLQEIKYQTQFVKKKKAFQYHQDGNSYQKKTFWLPEQAQRSPSAATP